jgi:hypothetical protein
MMNILPEFESRQVLTSEELNWMASYLDSQTRQSRRLLIGCGLIGGLQVKLVNNSIQVTNGIAVTSAGHIVKLQHANSFTTYTKIKQYTINEKDKRSFPYLCDIDDLQQNYTKSVDNASLYFNGFTDEVSELFEDTVNNVQLIQASSVAGKVVVVFAEINQKELKDCEDDNCQERGKKYIFNTKVLLISQQDALKLLSNQFAINTSNALEISKKAFPWLHLPGVNILKPVFSNLSSKFDEQLIAQEYVRCIVDFQDNLPASVDEALTNLNNTCSVVKSPVSFGQALKQFIIKNVTANSKNNPVVVQLVYDFLWKAVQAYQELQLEAQGLRARIFTEETAFPNHILLGLTENQNEDFANVVSVTDKVFRHTFYSQFTQTEQAILCKRIIVLLNRLKSLIDSFDDKIFADNKEIRLTPGGNVLQSLSQQAVPYYFKPTIANVWNQYANHLNLKQYITGYYFIDESKQAKSENQYNIQPAGFQGNPSFFRIEGVHGKIALTALNSVFQIRKKYGLSFQIIMLRLNDKAPFNHSFNYSVNEDIESMYQVVRSELIKQIRLNTAYLDSLQLKSGKFSDIQKKLIAELEKSYMFFLQNLNLTLLQPLTLVLDDAVIASNIATNNKAKEITSDVKFTELKNTVVKSNTESQPFAVENNMQAMSIQMQPINYMQFITFPVFTFFLNTLGSLVSNIKSNDKFKNTTDISFYSHLLTISKSMQKNEKQEILFLLSVQLYSALKLQEEYLNENFLEFKIEQYNKNLNEELMPACNSMINFLKKSSNDFVRNDNILEEVVKGEMLDYADRIKFDDDWIKINQIDAENKKRNGGLGVENLLDRFVGLHPGLTHGCGVTNGGTYIMVYNQYNTVTSDFYLPYIISSNLRPIQFTLLENKTLTLSGKVTGKGNPLEASILVGDATVFSNSEGFYNCLVAANTKLHVICTSSGFKTLEKDVEIKEVPVTLDFSLEEIKVSKTTTIQFIDQKNQKITDNITLIDNKNKQVIAENGVLKVSDENGTSQVFKVNDENFETKEFTVEVKDADKGENVQLTRVNVLTIQIADKSTGKFNPVLLKQIDLKDSQEKLVLKDQAKGIFVSENKLATDKTFTVQVLYNNVAKEQQVSSDKAVNIVVYEIIRPTNKREILSWLAVTYPTEIRTEVVIRKLKSLSLNGVSVPIDAATNIGNATVNYDGTLTLDPAFVNAPTIKIDNFEEIGAVIVLASTALIANKTDIKATRSIATFNKALSAEELTKLVRTGGDNSVFSTIHKKSDLQKENFYCLLFPLEQMKDIKTMLNV